MQEGRSATNGSVLVRPLTGDDVPQFLRLIKALADYEKLTPPDAEAMDRLARDATSEPPRFGVLLADLDGETVGYAVYFETYSTFLARPTLFLEDLFVLDRARGRGAGKALILEVMREATRRGCGRMEWNVLTWNAPSIEFYERLGAKQLDDWLTYRLTSEQLSQLV